MRTLLAVFSLALAFASARSEAAEPPRMLLSIGDSLGHGTMDATNNAWATANTFLGRVYYSLRTVTGVYFSQPFYDYSEVRIPPYFVPTNLAVDGADVFSVEGLEYGKRVGSDVNLVSSSLLADHSLPAELEDDYDKVLFPTNLLAGQPMSQVDSAIWLVDRWAPYSASTRRSASSGLGTTTPAPQRSGAEERTLRSIPSPSTTSPPRSTRPSSD